MKYKEFIPVIEKHIANGFSQRAACNKAAEDNGVNPVNLYQWYIYDRKNNKNEVITSTIKVNEFEQVLEKNEFIKSNWSHGWLKSKNASIFIKNQVPHKSITELRNEFISDLTNYAPSFSKIEYTESKDPHALVIDIADLHIGKLATLSETGSEYNSDIAINRAFSAINGILSRAKGYEIDKIFFIIGNDILHIDTPRRTTTSGTPQDTHGMWYDNFTLARKMYCDIIEQLLTVAPVEVIHCPSNHDYISGYMLADAVQCWFHNHPHIEFQCSPAHRKYTKYGECLLGFNHGDGCKTNLNPLLMATEAKEYWSNTTYRYIYLHHLHHKDQKFLQVSKDYPGINIQYLRSPSNSDSWHHRQGYTQNFKAIEAFVLSKEFGQVAQLTFNFK